MEAITRAISRTAFPIVTAINSTVVPAEIWTHIASKLDLEELAPLIRVDKFLHAVVSEWIGALFRTVSRDISLCEVITLRRTRIGCRIDEYPHGYKTRYEWIAQTTDLYGKGYDVISSMDPQWLLHDCNDQFENLKFVLPYVHRDTHICMRPSSPYGDLHWNDRSPTLQRGQRTIVKFIMEWICQLVIGDCGKSIISFQQRHRRHSDLLIETIITMARKLSDESLIKTLADIYMTIGDGHEFVAIASRINEEFHLPRLKHLYGDFVYMCSNYCLTAHTYSYDSEDELDDDLVDYY